MSGTFINIPANTGYNFKDPAPTYADLPLVGNADGDARVVVDEHALYIWNEGTTTWDVVTGGGGGSGITQLNGLIAGTQSFATGTSGTALNVVSAGSIHTFNLPLASSGGVTGGVVSNTEYDALAADKYKLERFTLDGTDISNEFVTLASTPTDATKTRLLVINGVEQDYGVDFTVTGAQLSWNGLGLDGVFEANDKIIVIYN